MLSVSAHGVQEGEFPLGFKDTISPDTNTTPRTNMSHVDFFPLSKHKHGEKGKECSF